MSRHHPTIPRRCFLSLLVCAATLLFLAGVPFSADEQRFAGVHLSAEENQWLKDHPVIRLAPDPDFKPIEYFDQNGAYQGAAADIIRILERKLGITITIVRPTNWDDAMEWFRRHEVDLLGAMVRTAEREKFALFTETLVAVPGGIFSRSGSLRSLTLNDLKGKKVAVVSNYAAHDLLRNRFPEIHLEVVPDISTGLAKSSLGMVDAYVENMATATFYSQEAGITNLQLVGKTDFDYRWSIGIRKDWPELQRILNKGLAGISEEERGQAIKRWIYIEGQHWRPSRTVVGGALASSLAVLLLLVMYWNASLRKVVRKRTASLQQELEERQKAEHAFKTLTEQLEERVRERTSELEKEVGERTRSEQAALSIGRQFRTLFQNISDPIYIADNTGRIIAANEQACRELGYTPDELVGLHISDIDAVDDGPEKVAAQLREVFAGKSATFESVHRRKDGSHIPVEVNVRPLDYDGRPAVLGVARNLSERKRADEALRRSESFNVSLNRISKSFLTLSDDESIYDEVIAVVLEAMGSPFGVFGYIDENGSLVCPSMTRNVWTQCQMGHKSIVFPPETWGDSIWGNGLRSGKACYSNRLFKVPDGHLPIERCLTIPLVFKGTSIGLLTVANKPTDYTDEDLDLLQRIAEHVAPVLHARLEQRRAASRLLDNAQRYQLLYDSMSQGMALHEIVRDAGGIPFDYRFLDVNPAFERIMTLPREQIIGRTARELIPDLEPHWIETYGRVALTGKPVTLESPVAIQGRFFEVYAYSPQHGQVAVLANDITEKKRQEDEKTRLEQQMMHAQKLESLGVLAGGIAHDFNNILTSVIGNADLALMQIHPESSLVGYLRTIEQGAARAADLARQMLAYSGRGKFVVEPLDINCLIEEMLHLLEVSISKRAALRFNLAKSLPAIEGDATQLRQVVMNVIINASEAIGNESGVIAISTGSMDCNRAYLEDFWIDESLREGPYVFLEVTDTGCGMDEDTAGKIFDPFFTTKFIGRGLGMAAVSGIIRGHKGAIKLSSEPGRGTTFRILFPAGGAMGALVKDEVIASEWRGSGVVLLVDDEEAVCAVGAAMLRALGFDVVTASNGIEALERYRGSDEVRCVILDLTMPLMDGEETFREMKKLDPEVKVVLSSGYSEHDVTQRFVGRGLAGFIQKPYNLAALREVLKGIA
jgi:PAS domain S-box-containing protein